jgi:SAM-dependent methyltransferase
LASDQRSSVGRTTADFWEDLYKSRASVWTGRPNDALVAHTAELAPGSALDLGCGEGGDAIWMAEQGWQVTAVDIAPTALERGAAAAARAGLAERIDWLALDVTEQVPPGPFDLVAAMFLQSPLEFAREAVLRSAASVVAPGGTLVVVSHFTSPPWSKHQHSHADLPSPEETVAALALPEDVWTVMVCERHERDATGPDGESATLEDAVVVMRRRSDAG